MKISVLIIAHNEEKYIERCLKSIVNQSKRPDEIILVAHNCTDNTENIAKKFTDIRLVSYRGPVGIVHARIKGFEETTGDIILCTDGDSIVMRNWVKNMSRPFEKDKNIVGVGSPVIYYGLIYRILCDSLLFLYSFFINNIIKINLKYRVIPYFWGPSMAIRKESYIKIGGLDKFLEVKEKLKLTWHPDDCYLAILLSQIGKLKITHKTLVLAKIKDKNNTETFKKSKEQRLDGNKLFEFFILHNLQ